MDIFHHGESVVTDFMHVPLLHIRLVLFDVILIYEYLLLFRKLVLHFGSHLIVSSLENTTHQGAHSHESRLAWVERGFYFNKI